MNYIFCQTKTLFTNTGDVLINNALISTLRSFGTLRANGESNIPPTFLSDIGLKQDEIVKSESEMDFVFQMVKCAIKSLFSGDKVYIFSGLGHTFGDSSLKIKRNYIAGFLFVFYKLLGIKTVRLGLTLGPLSERLAKSEKFRSQFIDKYWVRDSYSIETCKSVGIDKAELLPDLSWKYIVDAKRELNLTDMIVVNIRREVLEGGDNGDVESRTVNKLISMLKTLVEEGEKKIVVCYQVASDKEFSYEVFEILKNKFDNVEHVEQQLTLTSAGQLYSKAAYVFSNRMHCLLFSYKFGALSIPVINSDKHKKITCAYDDNGLNDYVVDVNDTRGDINFIVKNKEKMYRQIIQIESKNCRVIDDMINDYLKQ